MANMYLRWFRSRLRQLAVNILPAPIYAHKHLAVIGLPRSGTSWIAKALSLASGVSYYFEPEATLGSAYCYKYLPQSEKDLNLYTHVRQSFHGAIHDEMVICEQGLREIITHPFSHTVLVKWVRLILCLDWIAKNFPNLTVVQIIRHPVPLFLSWQQRNWDPDWNLKILLDQPHLMSGPLRPYVSMMRRTKTFWEKAGAFWGAMVRGQFQAHRPGWILLEHEWYCLDSVKRIRWLVEKLGLTWNKRIAEYLSSQRSRISGPGYGRKRDSKTEIHKWKEHISNQDTRELKNVIDCFALPFYPDLDPEAFWKANPEDQPV